MLGRVDQVGIVGLARAAAVLDVRVEEFRPFIFEAWRSANSVETTVRPDRQIAAAAIGHTQTRQAMVGRDRIDEVPMAFLRLGGFISIVDIHANILVVRGVSSIGITVRS